MLGLFVAFASLIAAAQTPEAEPPVAPVASPPEQTSQDWSIGRLESGDLVAFIKYDNGIEIGFRCSGGALSGAISGLPATDEPKRTLRTSIRGAAPAESSWFVGTVDTVAFNQFPSVMARSYRGGGLVRIGVPGAAEGGATLVYEVDLPPSPAAIDAVLSECNLPSVDPQDALLAFSGDDELPPGLGWERRPRPFRLTRPAYTRGFVGIVCVTGPDGGLRECRIDSELPGPSEFGQAALRSLQGARFKAHDGAPVGGRRVAIPVTFALQGSGNRSMRHTPSRPGPR